MGNSGISGLANEHIFAPTNLVAEDEDGVTTERFNGVSLYEQKLSSPI